MGDINQKHIEILRLEEKQKQIQEKVKNQKEKGFSPRSSKVAIEREQQQNENALFRLEQEVQSLESMKQENSRDFKQASHDLQQELNETKSSVRMLEFQLKEKEQELKLCELKIKELKKSMPNNKLKPIKARTGRSQAPGSVEGHQTFELTQDADDDARFKIRHRSVAQGISSIRARKYTQDATINSKIGPQTTNARTGSQLNLA